MTTPLLVTADETLLDELLRLSAAAGTTPEVAHDVAAALRGWLKAPLVLVGADLADALARAAPARRDAVFVVLLGSSPDSVFQTALACGAESVAELPRSEGWLIERLTDVVDTGPARGLTVGVIGGSGLYEMEEGLTRVTEVRVSTPFGSPSDAVIVGDLEGVRVAFLARHGRGHRISPSEINYRANIYALKKIGVERIISVSAVGSLIESHQPGQVVIPHQFIDQTKRRASTFFDKGIVAHVALADPVCPDVAEKLAEAVRKSSGTVHEGGSYLCIEGPQFSTRAESVLYRQWGADIIGMTNLPEAKLAREAELCYATMALVTDYDCWHRSHDAVTVEAVIETLHRNVALSRQVIRTAVPTLTGDRPCVCGNALACAVITSKIPPQARKRLHLLLGRMAKKT